LIKIRGRAYHIHPRHYYHHQHYRTTTTTVPTRKNKKENPPCPSISSISRHFRKQQKQKDETKESKGRKLRTSRTTLVSGEEVSEGVEHYCKHCNIMQPLRSKHDFFCTMPNDEDAAPGRAIYGSYKLGCFFSFQRALSSPRQDDGSPRENGCRRKQASRGANNF